MKQLFLICLIFGSWKMGFSQAGCYSDQSDTYWKIGLAQFGSKKLSNCDVSAYHNSHGVCYGLF
ncbi:hypothetical protein SAMN03080598_03183 [Algoriphagus boritolerans DSM 17298 = JCM 18970]|uniref:Uncharacterized protein n=1 Tax=Algoriphagus boritolerans DSM 17298 = JCM 18970 TaxID=1120964 RepID=A0A1H5YVJ7_9BACT|nr:hypothetical protein SAMN03080598_03183 [Algoriphagus boritolerans DSM 17298 = JCM 18970]